MGLPGFFYCGIYISGPCPTIQNFPAIRSPLSSVLDSVAVGGLWALGDDL